MNLNKNELSHYESLHKNIQLANLILVVPKCADIKGMVFHEKIPFLHSKIWSKHPVLKYFNINPTLLEIQIYI